MSCIQYHTCVKHPRFQDILGHTPPPPCTRAKSKYEQDQWRVKLFTKELEALDGYRKLCKIPHPCDVIPKTYTPDCRCSDESTKYMSIVPKKTGPKICPDPPEFSILSRGRSVCEYAQRRMWAAANEPRLNPRVTCGDIIPRINSHRRTSSPPPGRSHIIYPATEGMIPVYQGHVPGERFSVGLTFWNSTRNAKSFVQPDMLRPLCFPIRLD